MEIANIPGTPLRVSRVGLGTWAIGGWMWGGTDEEESVKTIHAAVERGVTLIDTAPAYGFGRSEEIVGRANQSLAEYQRMVMWTEWPKEDFPRTNTQKPRRDVIADRKSVV